MSAGYLPPEQAGWLRRITAQYGVLELRSELAAFAEALYSDGYATGYDRGYGDGHDDADAQHAAMADVPIALPEPVSAPEAPVAGEDAPQAAGDPDPAPEGNGGTPADTLPADLATALGTT